MSHVPRIDVSCHVLTIHDSLAIRSQNESYHAYEEVMAHIRLHCNALQCVALYCSVLQCVAVYCSVLQCVALYCSVLQCAAVCCSVLQCVAHDSILYTNESYHAYEEVMSHIRMSHVRHVNESSHTYE